MKPKYDDLQTKLAKIARRKRIDGRPVLLTQREAQARVEKAISLLKKNGFKDFIEGAGFLYDGTTFAHVTATATDPTKAKSWIVSAHISMSEAGIAHERKVFSNKVKEFEAKRGAQ